MRAISDELRQLMVNMIFEAGYDFFKQQRYSPQEMLCQDDEVILCLFIRYTTGQRKIEQEALEQIAVHKMLMED